MDVLDAGAALDALDLDAVRRWAAAATTALAAHRGEIDALNVFPVADGDTGSNLLATLRAGVAALAATADTTEDSAGALAALAAGAARGATGNSGFILSQFLRGTAETARAGQPGDAATVAAGLARGAELARSAVVTPVEGTMLTVARAAADAALAAATSEGAAGPATLRDTVDAAAAAARSALGHTTAQLPRLAEHGVVDAGGRGLVVVLDALATVVAGGPVPTSTPIPAAAPPARASGRHRAPREPVDPRFAFEVQYLLRATADDVAELRDGLAAIGDSVVVVALDAPAVAGRTPARPGPEWKVHVHVNDVGLAIEAGLGVGEVREIEVETLADAPDPSARPHPRVEDETSHDQSVGTEGGVGTAVVAVAPGAGLAHLFDAEGVHTVDGGTATPPSAADVLATIRATGAREVVLLPNASVVTGVAEAAAREARRAGGRVAVVPTRSPVQGLAAVAVHDANRPFDDDVVAMAEAAAATRFAEIAIATEEALTAVGVCQPGDTLGLIDGEVVEVGRGLLAVAFGLVDRLLGVGAELMTIVVGATAPPRAGELVEAHVRGRAPWTDVTVVAGGQHDHPLVIGAE
ncbi:DAK2 domain-containing protein [Jatrophihabitans endophyticus]|uniref:DAK2 domain-containing protein n=1 Tax=Jatrophihabitans endophyticus TaxID=1206085 RepID=UPI00190EFCC2|nr:DAK2 domain-containing protein [Jatrophihabitans endophyticus]